MVTKTFYCAACRHGLGLTVHCDGPDDPRVIDRQRLLAADNGWVIDLHGRAWCEKHRRSAAQ
jgi:hypothetical protein